MSDSSYEEAIRYHPELEYFRTFGEKIGIPLRDLGKMVELYWRLYGILIFHDDPIYDEIPNPEGTRNILKQLTSMESEHGLDNYDRPLIGESPHQSYVDGLEKTRELIASGIEKMYITGKMAVGKTHFIKELNQSGFLEIHNVNVIDDGEGEGEGTQTIYVQDFIFKEEIEREQVFLIYIAAPQGKWVRRYVENRIHSLGPYEGSDFGEELIAKAHRPIDFQKPFCNLVIDN